MILKNYVHGGDVYKNNVALDFSANVNPFGTPEAVKHAIREAADDVCRYPDPYCTALREKLAALHGVSSGDILCGNGAAELIFSFVQAVGPAKTLLPVPSFAEYETALHAFGGKTAFYSLERENGFALTADVIDAITRIF